MRLTAVLFRSPILSEVRRDLESCLLVEADFVVVADRPDLLRRSGDIVPQRLPHDDLLIVVSGAQLRDVLHVATELGSESGFNTALRSNRGPHDSVESREVQVWDLQTKGGPEILWSMRARSVTGRALPSSEWIDDAR